MVSPGFHRNTCEPFVKTIQTLFFSLKSEMDFGGGTDPSKNDGWIDRNEVLLRSSIGDEEVNKLVWRCLGYEMTIELDPETLTAGRRGSIK